LSSTLEDLGFEMVPHEPCCFIQNRILIFFYVDDIVLAYWKQDEKIANSIVKDLKKHYNITGGHDLQWFLGIEILCD
jgi:hypothetical protein